MMINKKYDVVVIGAGPGGYKSAGYLAKHGKTVCLIDRTETNIGGVCLNEGCIPTKSFLESSQNYNKLLSSLRYGLNSKVAKINMETIKSKADSNITQLRSGLLSMLKSLGIELMYGEASFINTNTISLKTETEILDISADNFIIATGSRSKDMPGFKFDGKTVLDSSQLFRSDLKAENILVVGGGYIGSEFASFYNNLGISVTIVEKCINILPGEDLEISKALLREFTKKGIRVLSGQTIKNLKSQGVGYIAELSNGNNCGVFDKIIVSIGREAKIQSLNLEAVNIKTETGYIYVDDNMRTSVSNIYAIGDVINSPMLAYAAYAEGLKAAKHILKEHTDNIDYSLMPRLVFSNPNIACVGITESQALAKNIVVKIHKKFFRANAKAVIKSNTSGFIKILEDKSTGQIVGVLMIGPEVCELIHVLSLAMYNKMTVGELAKVVFGHPTLAEIISDCIV